MTTSASRRGVTLPLAFLKRNDPHGRGGRYLCPFACCALRRERPANRTMRVERDRYQCDRCGASGSIEGARIRGTHAP